MKKLFYRLCAMVLTGLTAWQTTQAQEPSARALLEKIRKTSPKVVLADNSAANPARFDVTLNWKGERCEMQITNKSPQPITVNEILLFDAPHQLPGTTPIYGEAFQKLGQIGGTLAKPEDWGTYSDRSHYRIPEPEGLRTAYGMLTLQLKNNERVLLATTSCNKFISRFSFSGTRLRISIDCEGRTLQPGQSWNLEEFMAATDTDREKLYDRLTAAISKHHPKLEHEPVPVGWCSWYCFGPEVTEKNVADNMEWIANNAPALKYIQIDDGYQPWMGDWLDAGKAFGGDVRKVLRQIKSKNLEPAIWVAPFVASPQSELFKKHPDWMVKDKDGKPLRSDNIGFGGWRLGPWYVLDGTHPEVQAFFTSLFKTMREEWGCTYFKLDANYWGAIHGGVHYDTTATRIEAYRRGMEAILKGTGNAFVLGCNHPIWASLGLVHGSRSSMDTWRKWESFRDIGRENMLRGWQNGRLWWNDPDCLLLLNEGSSDVMDQAGNAVANPTKAKALPENEFLFHATAIYASGGMLLSGDDLTKITPSRLAILKKLIPPTGVAARFENERFEVGVTKLSNMNVYSVFNWSDQAADRVIKLPKGKYALTDKWTGQSLGIHQSEYRIPALAGRTAMIVEARKVK